MAYRKFRIRRADQRDLDVLVCQRRNMWESMGYADKVILGQMDRQYKRWLRRRMRNGTVIGWIVEDLSSKIIGGACLWLRPNARPPPNSEVYPYLTSMFTERAFRGTGAGSLIVREAIKWCKANGYKSILLHSSKEGRKFYMHLGFKRTWEMQLEFS
jgi:GNAT superfamily N-acetyltransferase